jgi:hypothetical protein
MPDADPSININRCCPSLSRRSRAGRGFDILGLLSTLQKCFGAAPQPGCSIVYSQRMATIGLMRAERRAGSSEAVLAISAKARMEAAKTQGSRADVP